MDVLVYNSFDYAYLSLAPLGPAGCASKLSATSIARSKLLIQRRSQATPILHYARAYYYVICAHTAFV